MTRTFIEDGHARAVSTIVHRMRIQLASDLHLELLARTWPDEHVVSPAPGADILVLAGDIDRGLRAIERFARWPVPVLYVAGNHEFYDGQWEQLRADMRQACEGTAVRFLDDGVVTLGGVRFLGSTLWTDYRLTGRPQSDAMAAAEDFLLDHRRIQTRSGPFRAAQALDDHQRSRAWLTRELARERDAPTVVVTHHGPHPASVHARFAGSPVNDGFVSDLADLVAQADLWLHGHVHDSFDYRVGRCRVVTNPRGYAQNRKEVTQVDALRFENPNFVADLLLEVPEPVSSVAEETR
jgi:predicted phosphodiesterase